MLVIPVMSTKSQDPPTIFKNGLTPSRTESIPSSVNSFASGRTCTTSLISGIYSFKDLSIPMVMVIVDEGHDPQAPSSSNLTVGPSISTNLTLPPSLIR